MYFNIYAFILQNIIQIWKYLTLTEKCYNHPRSSLHLQQNVHAEDINNYDNDDDDDDDDDDKRYLFI